MSKIIFRIQRIAKGPIPTPAVKKVMEFLDRQKPGILFPTNDLAGALGMHWSTLRTYALVPGLKQYRSDGGRGMQIYWGSKSTIAAYRKEQSQHGNNDD